MSQVPHYLLAVPEESEIQSAHQCRTWRSSSAYYFDWIRRVLISPLLGSFRWGQQQSRELSRLPECEDVQQEPVVGEPVVGDFIYRKGDAWIRVVEIKSGGRCECLNPYSNEPLSIPRAEVLEGLCEN